MIVGGFIMESSKKQALKMIGCNDALMDEAFFKEEGSGKDGGPVTTNNAAKKWCGETDPQTPLLSLSTLGPPKFVKKLNAQFQK